MGKYKYINGDETLKFLMGLTDLKNQWWKGTSGSKAYTFEQGLTVIYNTKDKEFIYTKRNDDISREELKRLLRPVFERNRTRLWRSFNG